MTFILNKLRIRNKVFRIPKRIEPSVTLKLQTLLILGAVIAKSDKPADVKLTEWVNQLRAIKRQQGVFRVADSRMAVQAFLNATSRLHHPAFVSAAPYPSDAEAQYLVKMLVDALRYAD